MSEIFPETPPAAAAPGQAAPCGHEFELGDVRYACARPAHPVGGSGPAFRHACDIGAELARGTDEGDGHGKADLLTWGEDGNGDGQDWEIAWGTLEGYAAGEADK